MKKKDNILGFRVSDKNKIYLGELGILHKGTGKTNRKANLSQFMNKCITIICELGIQPDSGKLRPTPLDLQRAMAMVEIHANNARIRDAESRIQAIISSLERFHTDSPKPLDSLLLSDQSTAILSEE